MPLENAVIAKILGSVAAVGSAGGAGIAYKDDIVKWWNSDNKTFLVQVSANATNFNKDYVCVSADEAEKEIDCTISKISNPNLKHITSRNVKRNKLDGITSHTELKKDFYYYLKIDVSKWTKEEKISPSTANLSIKSKDKKTEYCKLKVIASLDTGGNKSSLEKVEYFLGKISEIKQGTAATAKDNYAVNTSDTFSCSFDLATTPNLPCEIHQFSTDTVVSQKLSALSFTAPTTKITTGNIDKDKYYLIKLTTAVGWDTFKEKEIIYAQTGTEENKHTINFKETTPAILASFDGDAKTLLLLNN